MFSCNCVEVGVWRENNSSLEQWLLNKNNKPGQNICCENCVRVKVSAVLLQHEHEIFLLKITKEV